jgi:hypothetical protein
MGFETNAMELKSAELEVRTRAFSKPACTAAF